MRAAQGSIIQGCFQGNVPRQALASPRVAQAPAPPPTFQQRTTLAHQRCAGGPIQPRSAGPARALGQHLAIFDRRPGQPLPAPLQLKMERLFNADFSAVQLHVGPEAAILQALAFTHGSKIYFAPGRYNPATPAGLWLLGHELAHVVQQRVGRVRNPFGAGVAIVRDPALEAEAERMGAQAAMCYGPLQPYVQCMKRGAPTAAPTSGRPKRARPSPPDPVLSATHDATKDEEGYCGNFRRVRTWSVAHPVPGVIVQEVWRTFAVTLATSSKKLTAKQLNAYVKGSGSTVHAEETHYWELWRVSALGTITPRGIDTFGLCSIIPGDGTNPLVNVAHTTKGSFTMRGLAHFYPTDKDPDDLGFASGAVHAAGGLFSTRADPSGSLPAAAPGSVDYTVNVTWDSRTTDETKLYSTVT